jgi:phosphohistidine phosphatase
VEHDNDDMAATKHLLLLRHAKSSWDDPGLPDHDRPLALRGRRASLAIGSYLREHEIPISLVLCSSARRTCETVELVQPGGELQIEEGLYGASVGQLLERLRRIPEEADVVMLVGHNPSIEELALDLAADPDQLAGRKYPTGGLAWLSFTGPWHSLGPAGAELTTFVTPRELG